MDVVELINKKKVNKQLTKEEIEYFIKNYTLGNINEDDAAQLIKAIYENGMEPQEIADLTIAMAYSGDVLDLSELGIVVDKHSSGGVGDKITLILMPIMAAMGVIVAKMSGRGLGFTGGTADKLESIPGYRTQLNINEFINNVKEIGISLITQTENLAPADKKIYALRNKISCTDSIPLIASSIMSKKIAAGANKIVLDVTCGSGAFMKNIEDARKLSTTMKQIGELVHKEVVCIITNMDQPLGYSVGNSIEMIEVLEALKGTMQDDVKEVVLELGSYILKLAGKGNNLEENKLKIEQTISSGKAYDKFIELVKKQNGDISYCLDINKFKKSKYQQQIICNTEGYIEKINAEIVGKIACYLGAGRIEKNDSIDMEAGIVLNYKVGDYVKEGKVLATLFSNDLSKLEKSTIMFNKCINITNQNVAKQKMILDII